MSIAAGRLAESASPIPVTLRDGTRITLRPLIPDDRGRLDEVIRRAPPEMLRSRFFTSGPPSPQIVDYLVNINYVDHFAWWVMTADDGLGVGVGRYVRLSEDPACAELAFAVTEAHQRRGIGTLLLGALAVAASTAGIEHFSASVLAENASMRAVLDKVGARWRHGEPGVLSTRFPVESAIALAGDAVRAQIERVAGDVVTGAGLALTRR
jgi:protein lysine acetyltransferase